jgi:hypothetical protein
MHANLTRATVCFWSASFSARSARRIGSSSSALIWTHGLRDLSPTGSKMNGSNGIVDGPSVAAAFAFACEWSSITESGEMKRAGRSRARGETGDRACGGDEMPAVPAEACRSLTSVVLGLAGFLARGGGSGSGAERVTRCGCSRKALWCSCMRRVQLLQHQPSPSLVFSSKRSAAGTGAVISTIDDCCAHTCHIGCRPLSACGAPIPLRRWCRCTRRRPPRPRRRCAGQPPATSRRGRGVGLAARFEQGERSP